MAQADDTVPQCHISADGWGGEEVRSPNTGQHQPLSDLNLFPTMGNQDYPDSPDNSHTHISACCSTFSTRQTKHSSAQIIAKPPSLHHPCQAADPPSLFPVFSQHVLPHTPKAFLSLTHSSANRDHWNISRKHLQRKPLPAWPI